ncbi:uncharacterized protein B0H18DRAFT_1113174 [Fomitopsis serialis]|uniref:uncharacterized protein n=1 Tax=Fomitopsis serialis TaxID=139415 RepID=UPI0020083EAE|nr:uncharacterized protein B0H18DRAFT_1113174 [Neoantrodia serialis]KAH9937317.1 hypothetical protein B0H18DRAFT_1113174 [Neoantrodia serialis]
MEGPPSALHNVEPASYVVFVSLGFRPEYEEEFNRWYDEEHIPMLAKAPGWIRTRRFVLKDWEQMGVEGQKQQKEPPKYLAMHKWKSADGSRVPSTRQLCRRHGGRR